MVQEISFGQAPIVFERYYDFGFTEEGFSVQQTNDKGFIVAGEQRMGIGFSKLLLQKTDSAGNLEWVKIYGSPYENGGLAVKQTFDHGYIVTGYTTNSNYAGYVYLLKTDSIGDTLWTKKLSSPAYFQGQGKDILQTSDSGFVLIAQGNYFSTDTAGIIFLMKTDKYGDTLWTNKIRLLNGPYGSSIKQTTDGGFIIGGNVITSTNPTHFGLLIIKTDANGDTLWTKVHTDPISNNLRAYSVQQTSDGGYFLVGNRAFTTPFSIYLHIEKTDANGDTLWTRDIGNGLEEGFAGGMQTNDGGYIAGGFTAFGLPSSDVYLVKTNSTGIEQWHKTFGGISDDQGNNMQLTSDGGCVITGITLSFGLINGDVYLIKTDSTGYAPTGISEIISDENSFSVFPNPNNGKFNVQSSINKVHVIEIYNQLGKKIYETFPLDSQETIAIDISENSVGIYLIIIRSEDGSTTSRKIIISH